MANLLTENVVNPTLPNVTEADRCIATLKLLKRASNWGHFAGITIQIEHQPLTTIGNLIAEALVDDV